jgi:sporulation protein YlmC with PRC-barrel domain
MNLLASTLKDKEVMGEAGRLIGKVKDGTIDEKTWQLTDLEVELQGNVAKEFHLKKTFGTTTVPIAITFVGAVGDKVVLKASTEEIGKSINETMMEKAK